MKAGTASPKIHWHTVNRLLLIFNKPRENQEIGPWVCPGSIPYFGKEKQTDGILGIIKLQQSPQEVGKAR